MGETSNLFVVSLPLPWGSSQVFEFKAERFVPHRLGGTGKCLSEVQAEDCITLSFSLSQNEESGFDLVPMLSQKELSPS